MLRIKRGLFFLVSLLSWDAAFSAGTPAVPDEETIVYINYSPDRRYSINGEDSRIAFNVTSGVFAYGNVFDKAKDCSTKTVDCIRLRFIGLASLKNGHVPAQEFSAGSFSFSRAKESDVCLIGKCIPVVRVDVKSSGKHSNYFLFNEEMGVVAIGVPNSGADNVHHLLFILAGDRGVFTKRATSTTGQRASAESSPVQPKALESRLP